MTNMAADRTLRFDITLLPLLGAAALIISGCSHSDPGPLPVWAVPPVPYSPSASSGNAFDAYVEAASSLEATHSSKLTEV